MVRDSMLAQVTAATNPALTGSDDVYHEHNRQLIFWHAPLPLPKQPLPFTSSSSRPTHQPLLALFLLEHKNHPHASSCTRGNRTLAARVVSGRKQNGCSSFDAARWCQFIVCTAQQQRAVLPHHKRLPAFRR